MSWETKTVMEQRKAFVTKALLEDSNVSELCRQYGISRKTGHKWIKRAELGLPLCDQSRRPHLQPSKTAEELEEKIVRCDFCTLPGAGKRSVPLWKLQV